MNASMYRQFFLVQQSHWWFTTRKKIVLDTIARFRRDSAEEQILDIGCGCGVMLNSLNELGSTYGLDMSDDAIAFCNEIFGGEVKRGHLPDQVPFPREKFSLITALDVIEHIDLDQQSLKTLHDLLQPKGLAIVTVPAYQFLWSKFDEMNEHKRRYTRHELQLKLQNAGFKIEKISYFNSLLFPLVFAIRMVNKVLGRNGASDIELPGKRLNALLGKIFGLEVSLLRTLSLPFGVSIIAVVRK